MNTSSIASNIKHLRDAHHWSQEELAIAAGVDVRTIQRAEAGRPTAVDTLKAIAAAFDTTIEALQVTEEEIVAFVGEFQKTYKIIEMQVIGRSSEIGHFIAGAEAFLLERIGDLSEEQLDQIAEFQSYLHDYLDIWRDMEAGGQRDAEKLLNEMVNSLKASAMSVSFGLERMSIQPGTGQPFHMSLLYIAVTKGTVPMLALARPKNVPLSFAI